MKLRFAFVSAIVGGSMLAGISPASAEWIATYSTIGYYGPLAGVNYNIQSETVARASNDVSGYVYVKTDDGANVATGWVGAMARLYRDSGALCTASAYYYNSAPQPGIAVGQYGYYCGAGAYYSQGIGKGWNGSGYNAYWSLRTPSLNP